MTSEKRVGHRLAALGARLVGAAVLVRETENMQLAARELERVLNQLSELLEAVELLREGRDREADGVLDFLMDPKELPQ